MKKTSTLYNKSVIWTGILAMLGFSLQVASSQDFDFQQDPATKLVVMEAENFSDNIDNGAVVWEETAEPADFSGTGAMMAVTPGSFATAADALAGSAVLVYKINFTQTGNHYIWARAAKDAANAGGTDSYHVGIGVDIPESGTFLNFSNTPGGYDDATCPYAWIYWCNPISDQGYVTVPSAGVHEFTVYIRETSFKIDKIVLSTEPYVDSTGYFPWMDDEMGPDETLAPSGILSAKLNSDAFSIFPNPIGDRMQINIRDYSPGTIEIFDITGKVVKRVAADYRRTVTADVSGLDAGVYFVKLDRAGKTVGVKKMLKL